MQRIAQKLVGIGIVLSVSALSYGCADNNSTVYIRQVIRPDVDSNCGVSNDPSADALGQGNLDRAISGSDTYRASVLVGNQLVRRGDPDQLRTETGRVQFFQADIEIFDFNGNTVGGFSQPVAGFADPSTGTTPGFGVVGITLADSGSINSLDLSAGGQTIVARIQIFGETLGGLEVETGFYDFPIFVCDNCFACTEPESCDDEVKTVCAFGQDEAVDCRCVGSSAVCPVSAASNCG